MVFCLIMTMLARSPIRAQQDSTFAQYPAYNGNDLGLTYQAGQARVRVWAPTAEALALHIYETGLGGKPQKTIAMQKADGGTWVATLPAATSGFYTVQATISGKKMAEVAEPYAHAVGANGQRAAFVDPDQINPQGWLADKRPTPAQFTDIIIGELHVRDLSMHPASGIKNKGKYLGLTEEGTRGPQGVSTGLDHLAELGITHVHLLPTNDYASVDETQPQKPQFNWGYDPLNYTVPEGSYATQAAQPAVRIKEFKQMVQALHGKGLGLVLDVVYNHTFDAGRSAFEQLVPGYYYRQNAKGGFSDASGCGNEVASDRPMVRKLIVESVAYWAKTYHVDGFRFDLMGILDLETMRAVSTALDKISPNIFVYGEGWTAGNSPYPYQKRALKANTHQLDRVAAFCDEMRDGIKGHFARHEETGFAGGKPGLEESLKFGIVAACQHPQLDYKKVNYSQAPWASTPGQCINYVACHDDMVLWDKLAASLPNTTEAERRAIDLLCNTIVFTSQGVPFLPIGDEFLRTKQGISNSYNKPDSINQLDWARKARYQDVFNFYKQLISLRRNHPAFRLPTAALIAQHVQFLPSPAGIIAYQIKGHAGGDRWGDVTLIFNGNRTSTQVPLPAGTYQTVLKGDKINELGLGTLTVANGAPLTIDASSALILTQGN